MLSFFKPILGLLVGKPNTIAVPAVEVAPVLQTPRLPTSGPTVAFVNKSSVLNDAQITAAVAAMQIQVDRDFSPIWKIDANLVAVPRNSLQPSDAWVLYIMDTSDQAGALGYHDLTSNGNPVGKIFAKDDLKYGLSWSVTMSHELLEMLVDPYIQNCVFDQIANTAGTLYAYEVCDACENDSFGYTIDGVLVSDFVYPAWFEGFRTPNSTKFDFRGVLHSPFMLANGGYIGTFVVGPQMTGWTQKVAQSGPGQRLLSKGPYSRTHRRAHKA